MNYPEFQNLIDDIKRLEETGNYIACHIKYAELIRCDLDPEQEAIVWLGDATCFLRERKVDNAIPIVERALQRVVDPTVTVIAMNLYVCALHEMGNFNKALAVSREAISKAGQLGQPGDELLAEAMLRHGFSLAALGQYGDALALLNAINTEGMDEELILSLHLYSSFCLEQLGNIDDALENIQLFEQQRGKASRELLFRIGTVSSKAGRYKQALAYFNRALLEKQDGRTTDRDIVQAVKELPGQSNLVQ